MSLKYQQDHKEVIPDRPFEVQENLTLENNLGTIIEDTGVNKNSRRERPEIKESILRKPIFLNERGRKERGRSHR